jgi:hypothetical protein
MKAKPTNKARRNFLVALGLTSAGVATVALVKSAPEPTTQVATNEAVSGRGYQETDHVRSYYKTTRV